MELAHPTCQIPGLDAIYAQYLPPIGSFVEVGAMDGMTYSNTWHLANAGWTGLYIEPYPELAEACIHNHRMNPKITTVACACGAEDGNIDLILCGDVSTTKLTRWTRDWGISEETPILNVPMFKLETLLFIHKIEYFDLLVIDVEEAEIEVLKGFNIRYHNPKMVVIELHEGQGTKMKEKGWQTPWVDGFLKEYKKVYADKINSIYVLAK